MNEVIYSLCVVTYDGIPTIGLNHRGDVATGRVKITEETISNQVSQLSYAFAKRIPRLGDYFEIYSYIIKGLKIDPYFIMKIVMENAPNENEKEDGWRNGLILRLFAEDGSGCVNWESSAEHIFYNVKGDIKLKQVWGNKPTETEK